MATRIISTLCPKRLPPADFVSLSGRVQPRLTLPQFGTTQLLYGLDNATRLWMPFPPDSDGFLYYYTPPKAPPFVGEIRFRRASNPESFHDGEDLMTMEKTPWSLPLYDLANRGSYAVLRNQLVHDGLVSPTVLEKWTRNGDLPSGSEISERRCPGAMLYYLRQPFFHRFDKFYLQFYTITKERINFCQMSNFTRVTNRDRRSLVPYNGELKLIVGGGGGSCII